MRKRGLSGKAKRATHARNSGNEQIARNTLQEFISTVSLKSLMSHFWGIMSQAIPTGAKGRKNSRFFTVVQMSSVRSIYQRNRLSLASEWFFFLSILRDLFANIPQNFGRFSCVERRLFFFSAPFLIAISADLKRGLLYNSTFARDKMKLLLTRQGNISKREEHAEPHVRARAMRFAVYLRQIWHKRSIRARYAAICSSCYTTVLVLTIHARGIDLFAFVCFYKFSDKKEGYVYVFIHNNV